MSYGTKRQPLQAQALDEPEEKPRPDPVMAKQAVKEPAKADTHAIKLATVRKACLAQAGQEGKNPFLWMNEHLVPLERLFSKGDRSELVLKQIEALPDSPDCKTSLVHQAE